MSSRRSKPLTPMVKRNFRWIIRHAATRTEANCVRTCALEVIEPKLKVDLAGIVLHERELCPPHWFVDPIGCGRSRRDCVRASDFCPRTSRNAQRGANSGHGHSSEKRSPGQHEMLRLPVGVMRPHWLRFTGKTSRRKLGWRMDKLTELPINAPYRTTA